MGALSCEFTPCADQTCLFNLPIHTCSRLHSCQAFLPRRAPRQGKYSLADRASWAVLVETLRKKVGASRNVWELGCPTACLATAPPTQPKTRPAAINNTHTIAPLPKHSTASTAPHDPRASQPPTVHPLQIFKSPPHPICERPTCLARPLGPGESLGVRYGLLRKALRFVRVCRYAHNPSLWACCLLMPCRDRTIQG